MKNIETFQEFQNLFLSSNLEIGIKGFEYRLLSNLKGEYTSFICHTSMMQENFERFGGFISIDAMKRVLNTNSWWLVFL